MERQGRKLDQSDMIGSSLFQRKVDSLFAVNTIYEDDEKQDNKGLVIDVKGWLKYKVKYEYSIVDDEFGKAGVIYNYENFETAKPKKQKAKEAIFNILFYDPDDAKTKNQLINLTQINFRTVENAIKQLIDDDKIEAIGTTTDRRYKIKLKNNFIDNLKRENGNSNINSNNSPMCINSCESTNKTYIYQYKDSNNTDVRVMLESEGKNSNSNITLTSDVRELTPVIPSKSTHSNIDLSCVGELEDDNFNREEIPF